MQKSLTTAVLIGALFAIRMPCGAATPSLTTLYSFPGPNGAFPEAGLVLNNGALFGTAYTGGSDWGTVFELSQSGGVWSINQLYAFTGGVDGANPRAGVIFSSRGVIFGTTEQGGTSGYGTVFSLTPATGGTFTEKVLYSFAGAPSGCGTTGNPACDGANPLGVLTLSSSGALYSTTYGGGSVGWGTVFQLTQAAGVWSETVLYSFN